MLWYYPKPVQMPNWAVVGVVVPVMIAIGAVASQASFDLELPSGALNYALYLISTVLLRFIIGLDPRWQQ